jgi:hypothetical protein
MTKPAVRFGRRLSIPSTVQTKHELRAFCAQEDVREECAAKEALVVEATWDEIYAHRAAVAAELQVTPSARGAFDIRRNKARV